jgi:hypothetical protein
MMVKTVGCSVYQGMGRLDSRAWPVLVPEPPRGGVPATTGSAKERH